MQSAIRRLFVVSLVAVGLIGIVDASRAQVGDRSPLAGLLEALRGLEEKGGLDASPSGGLLDAARVAAERRAADRQKAREEQLVSTQLTPDELILVEAYCQSTLTQEQERFVTGMPGFSVLERDYCRRARTSLFLIGYESFGSLPEESVLTIGAAPADFRLGIGDELIVTVVGNNGFSRQVSVDREGRIILPNIDPVGALGLTLDEFRRALDSRLQESFIGTESYVSLGSVRSISVFVAGEVELPGAKQLTALSTLLDAINFAGGIKKTGSLRQVALQRGSETRWFDFYDVLFGFGQVPSVLLQQGDIIRVLPLGPTVAVTGDVKRPGVVEIPERATAINAIDAIRLAGGLIRPRGNVFSVRTTQASGRDLIVDYRSEDFVASVGDIITVRRAEGQDAGTVELVGEVTVPGIRSLEAAQTVAGLLGSGGILSEKAYRQFAVLQTVDPATGAARYFPIDLQRVIDGIEDFSLREQDILIVLSVDDIKYLVVPVVQAILKSMDIEQGAALQKDKEEPSNSDVGSSPTIGSLQGIVAQIQPTSLVATDSDTREMVSRDSIASCSSLVELRRIVKESSSTRFSNASLFGAVRTSEVDQLHCPAVYETFSGLLPFVLEHAVAVQGEVRRPGLYPISGGIELSSIVSLAGGATNSADLGQVELSHFGAVGDNQARRQLVDLSGGGARGEVVLNGDIVRVSRVFSELDGGTVTLTGEFLRPGTYDIRRGERLSSLIARAGGLTAQAFPYGAVFTRESVKRSEEVALRRLSRELNAAVAVAAANRGIEASAIQAFAQLTREVAEAPASGRVVIEADPTVLQVRPELDVVLDGGDRVFMPKRPSSVLVTGDVLNPGALQFVAGATPDRYIRQAGGFQFSADESRLFVVFPNGVATPISVSAFNYTPVKVPPGSTIVVPKDATPFNLLTISRELASVLSQLAITAASLAVISNQ